MADQARKKTDKILSDMEKQLYKEYSRAADEITKKWYDYMQSHEKTLKGDYEALMSAKKSGDKEEIRKAKEKYEKTMKNITLNNDRYNAMLNETTAKLSHINEVATNYVNDNMAKIYTLNYNAFANEDITGYTFTLVNENAVKNLATKDKLLLPKKKVDVPKDKAWNKKNINSELIQGILQGESVSKISKRLVNVVNMNEHSSIRNARTMVTSAENKGKLDSFKKAEDDGVVLTREWVATQDERTRAWHAALDGVAVKVDQPWVNEYGEIMYPGDPDADPCNVYNCRCTMRGRVQGFNWSRKKIINSIASYNDVGIFEGDIYRVAKDITNTVTDNISKLNKKCKNISSYLKQGKCYFVEETGDRYGVMSAVTNASNKGVFISKFVFGNSSKNKDIYSSIQGLENYVAGSVKRKWYMPCSKAHLKDYLSSHEYGHVVQNYILNRDYDWSKFKTSEELANAYNDRCKEMYRELVKTGIDSGIMKDLPSAVDELSNYSLKKAGQGTMSDIFAESFANMVCGSPNVWGKTMKVYLQQKGILKKGK